MNEKVIMVLLNSGMDALVVALVVNILTWIVKKPIKNLAQRAKNPNKITRFITFLPVILSFGVVAVYKWMVTGHISVDKVYLVLWLSSSSLSLAIYSFYEKFFQRNKADKLFDDRMLYDSYRLLESLSGIENETDLRSIAKLVSKKCEEIARVETVNNQVISETLKGLIDDESLDAISKALASKWNAQRQLSDVEQASTEQVEAAENSVEESAEQSMRSALRKMTL